jgi:SAM-dependent MidA family methyltransferase
MSPPEGLEALLLEWITRRGPMPFAAYMQMALYHPHLGYYARDTPRTGWSGDFVTSPELDPAFGELWGRGLEQIWEACGSPDRFQVAEVGPGEGGFAEAVLSAATGRFAEALDYRLVERNPHSQERQRARLGSRPVRWVDSILELPPAGAGVAFANEVLDNLPVHLVEKRNGLLREVCVDAANGELFLVLLPPSTPHLERFLDRTGIALREGHRMEVPLAVEGFVARLASTILSGAVLLVDYGDEAPALALRPEGSLVTYSATGADDEPLDHPGEKDITAHVNWTAVRAAGAAAGLEMTGPRPQRELLLDFGLAELDAELRSRHQDDLTAGDGAGALEALSRRHALAALADGEGLGGAGVMGGWKALAALPWLGKSAPVSPPT